ncbi:MAG: hypothetical protein ACPLRR_02790 [Candidatus Saccharicenans sp.]
MKKTTTIILIFSLLTLTLLYSKPEAVQKTTPLSTQEMENLYGNGWLLCVGAIATVAAAIAMSGGTVAGLAAVALSAGLSVTFICGCASYFDAVLGTNYVAACNP